MSSYGSKGPHATRNRLNRRPLSWFRHVGPQGNTTDKGEVGWAWPMAPLWRVTPPLVLNVSSRRLNCRRCPCKLWLPPINSRGGVRIGPHHSTQLNSSLSLRAWGLHPRCLGSLGGVEEEQESEEESGEVTGLSALFSACTSTDAYQSVSVRDFISIHTYLTSSCK